MRRVSAFGVLFLLFAGTSARAQELAPRVDHLPVAGATRGTPVEIRALIASPAGHAVFEPAVFVRLPGLPRFTRLAMQPETQIQDLFAATVPAALVTADFDYYLEAFDAQGNGPGRAGSPEKPFHIAVAAPAAAVVAPTADRPVQVVFSTPQQPLRPRSHSATTTLGLLGGLATSAGLGAGWVMKVQASEFEAARRNGVSYSSEQYQEGKTLALLANVPLAIGGALLTGALVSALWPEDDPPEAAPRPPAATGPGGLQ